MMMVAGVADVGVQRAGEFDPLAPHVVVVASLKDTVAVDEFSHTAEVVSGVEELVERGGGGGDEFPLRVVLLEDGAACGVALFRGLVASGPEVAFVRDDAAQGISLHNSDAPGQAVIGELGFAVVRVSDFDQAVLGVPLIGLPAAFVQGVAVRVIRRRARA
ncbi:MAG: hypothetical protein RLZZ245_895, partial [Verrucomicrobiota bacterium]